MYRFEVANNRSDVKFIVVAAVLFILLCWLFLHTFIAQCAAIILTSTFTFLTILKVHKITPKKGIVLLNNNELTFSHEAFELRGEISKKSNVYPKSVWLYVVGFSKADWLIINNTSIDEQSLARLRRAVVSAQRVNLESE